MELLFHTYQLSGMGVLFNGWPDGGPLLKQPRKFTTLANIFQDEVGRWADHKRQQSQARRR